MKTGTKKILSLILSTAMTMQTGLALAGKKTNAANGLGGKVTVSGGNVYLETAGAGTVGFTITKQYGQYLITCDDPQETDDDELLVSGIDKLKLGGGALVDISADLACDIEFGGEFTQIDIKEGYTLRCSDMDGIGILNIYGTLEMPTFRYGDYVSDTTRKVIMNHGTIKADEIDLMVTTYFTSYDSSNYIATDYFYKGEEEIPGTVTATSSDTMISSEGGTLNLKLGSYSKTFSGDVYGSAGSLLYESTSVTLNNVPEEILVGTDYNAILGRGIRVSPPEYTGTPYVEFAPAEETDYAPDSLEDPGTYNVRAVAPEVEGYLKSESDSSQIEYRYLTLQEINGGATPYTLEGIVNEYYIPGKLKMVPVTGYKIASDKSDGGYQDSLEFSRDDLYNEDDNPDAPGISFKRDEDDAQTDFYSWNASEYEDYIFDEYDPSIGGEMADGMEVSIEDGATITADELSFYIYDDNLDTVTVDGQTYTEDSGIEEGYIEITLNSTAGESKAVTITATDKAGKELNVSFTLNPNPTVPDLTVTPPSAIWAAEDYDIDVDTNSNGEISYVYRTNGGTVLAGKPTTVGKYSVTVTVAATDLYYARSATANFEIWRNVADITLTVKSPIYVGEELDVDLETTSDGVPEYTYRYNDIEGMPERSEVPTEAGSYLVIVHIPATDNYNEIMTYKSLRIIKRDVTCSVSVPDTYVGEPYDPEITHDSNGEVTVTYTKDGVDTLYTTKPTAAGTYTVTVSISETAEYNAASCSDTFTISKFSPLASIELDDQYIGTRYDPVLTTDSNGKDHAVIEYKVKGADDSTYDETKPTGIGTYTVRATIPATAEYEERVCTDDFEIKYLTAPAAPYELDGTRGENGYFLSDVTVKAPSGYGISSTYGGDYESSIPYSEGMTSVYLKRTSNGALTSSIALEEVLIDKEDPSLFEQLADYEPHTIVDGEVIIADQLVFSVLDDNLDSVVVTIDGTKSVDEHDMSDTTYNVALRSIVGSPSAVSLVATDKAGRQLKLDFTLAHTPVDPEASVTVPDTYVGEDYDPKITTNSDGIVTVTYTKENVNTIYTTKPTAAGNYTVKVKISATSTYNEITVYDDFTISKRTPTASISVPDTKIYEKYEATLTTDSDGKADAVIEYKPMNAADSAYTTEKPTAKGTYNVRAVIPETRNFLGKTCTSGFTIHVLDAVSSVSVENPFVGMDYVPELTTDSDDTTKAYFEYKPVSAADSEYTRDKPSDAGKYIVRATVPETEIYGKSVCKAEFEILYLPAPDTAYEMTGTAGDNDFFTSDVELKAPEGYKISSSFRGDYLPSIPYSDDLNVIYLKRDDGALTSAIALESRPKIDKETPSITDPAGSLTDGSTLYVNEITVTASDDNLLSIFVNNKEVDLATLGNIISLSPGNGIMKFKITAVDMAGNTRTIEFTLMAEWLKDRVIPADLLLPLQAGEGYILNDGTWTVVNNNTGVEDKTVYSGGCQFYVSADGDFTFSKVS